MPIRTMTEFDLKGKRVFLREDLNAPIKDGRVANDARLRASLPTIKLAADAGAKVMVVSHLGRPTEGEYDEASSLKPVAARLAELLGKPVRVEKDWIDGLTIADGEVVVCENVRFLKGEKKNNDELAKKMAALCDVYVMDAFGTAHRAQSSTHGIAKYAPIACAGPLLAAEVEALGKALLNPAKPLVAIVGGAKVSTKLTILDNLIKKVDTLIVGGGIANNFLAAAGFPIGKSLCEPELVAEAKRLLDGAKAVGRDIPIPSDVVCAAELSVEARPFIKNVADVSPEDMILDIGPQTAKRYAEILKAAGTVIWNGPVGVFEFDQFAGGTKVLGHAIADSKAFSLAGGGDTISAIEKFGFADQISYISTGGGSFLEFLEGKVLPAVEILEQRAAG